MPLTHDYIVEKLKSKFGNDITDIEAPYGLTTCTVPSSRIIEVLTFLKNDPELNFMFLTDLTGIHYPDHPEGEKLGVIYHLHNLVENVRLRMKTFMPKEAPFIDSATALFAGANWMERETYDFFGIIFNNHPNLKRILNVDDLHYYPLRKEYALEDPTRDDKDDRFFGR
ncbi:MAG: NADH-quinone oxidoreductase subunit C [Cytophagaceae bacterium]|nr:NADH-quinone oxidoreductase subunit C [Cytophagaceae bacterium]MDW8455981.1 NADH-quinone oxidoreductase subunit C [Cytophagaceae bacterium]